MKTDPVDGVGFHLPEIINGFEMKDHISILSERLNEDDLAKIYNVVDATINISNAEGFGMATLESLSCGTPIIATWTGGMREQLADDIDNVFQYRIAQTQFVVMQ